MAVSFFSYNISRPYPFKWFTAVVLLGGTLFTVFVSLLNFSADGYIATSITFSLLRKLDGDFVDFFLALFVPPTWNRASLNTHYRTGCTLGHSQQSLR